MAANTNTDELSEPTVGTAEDALFSQTNLIESNVDEADRVKFDGEFLYVAELQRFSGDDKRARVKIYQTETATPSSSEVAEIILPVNDKIEGIYLEGQRLIVITQVGDDLLWHTWFSPQLWQEGEISIFVYDVSDKLSPDFLSSIIMQGNLLNSRKVEGNLYIVNRFKVSVMSEEVELADYLPFLKINGTQSPLLAATDCYVAPIEEPNSSFITIVSAIDLAKPDAVNSLCFNGDTSGFYASGKAVYLSQYDAQNAQSFIHKFSYKNDEVEYSGSGSVPGGLGVNNSHFRMSEFDNDLRVVSTVSIWDEDTGREFNHYLSIFSEDSSSQSLQQRSQIPNEQQSKKIGKPGEDIFAVRFVKSRAYVVTFLQTDPFYIIDVSDPDLPVITGELEVPGFSTLLQPLDDDTLLGIGESELGFGQVKVELFDVSDIAHPASRDVLLLNSYYSEALYQHHAISLLPQADAFSVRVAFPLRGWDGCNSIQGLQMLTVNLSTKRLADEGALLPAITSSFARDGERAVLADDAVFYMTGNDVTSDSWGNGDSFGSVGDFFECITF
ncbi:beta-propeller domain-containing protein [Oceanicoccus sp. KOV_DT_Chl]|uniref:beta-propeller domain-containing protein n=1 Tax=Oceanicoccus sp. KOV_DT_Chl TaxID=1904639 RepID=UPI000C7AA389|nr:beta-propeller domain-containing protein [Oceanicoccus sp. KOV_DT_Chl]